MAREKKKKKMERRGNGFIGKTLVRRELGFISVFKFKCSMSFFGFIVNGDMCMCVYRCVGNGFSLSRLPAEWVLSLKTAGHG